MGRRKEKTQKEIIQEIGDIEEKHCKNCPIKTEFRKNKSRKEQEITEYCFTECKHGRKIRALGGLLDYGVYANEHFKAPDFTKEKYIEMKAEGKSEKEVYEEVGISRSTLTKRKKAWGLTTVDEYIFPTIVLKGLTKETLAELSEIYTDKEIAEMNGVSKSAIQRRRKRWGIEKSRRYIRDKYSKKEYEYLSQKKSLKDYEIADLWEISDSSLFSLKRTWGFVETKKVYTDKEFKELGLDREKLIALSLDYTDEEIAEMFNTFRKTITKYRSRLKVSRTDLKEIKKDREIRRNFG